MRNKYAMVDRIKVKRAFGFTCPVKTLAIFAHNDEMSLLPVEMPENVKLVVESCKTRQDVKMLVESKALPRVTSGNFWHEGEEEGTVLLGRPIADIFTFDPSSQSPD